MNGIRKRVITHVVSSFEVACDVALRVREMYGNVDIEMWPMIKPTWIVVVKA